MKRAWMTALAAVLCVSLTLLFGSMLIRYTSPLNSTVYDWTISWSGEAMPDGWRYDDKGWTVFAVRDGEQHTLKPDGFGGFFCEADDDLIYFSRVLTEKQVDAPTLQIYAYNHGVAAFLEDELLYSDGALEADGLALNVLGWERSTPLLVPLPDDYLGKRLTIAQTVAPSEPAHGSTEQIVFPCSVTFSCGYAYESGLIAESFRTALSAALPMTVGLFLLVAFFVSAWHGRWNGTLLCAALYNFLCLAGLLADTSFFSIYHPAIQRNVIYLCRCFALSALIAFLASQAPSMRFIPWALAALNTLCSLLTLYIELTHDGYTDNLSLFLHDFPFQTTGLLSLIVLLLCAWMVWRKQARFYRLFALLMAAGLFGLLLAGVLFHRELLLTQLILSFRQLQFGFFLWPLMYVTATTGAISAIVDLVLLELEHRIEARRMRERGEIAMASYKSLCAQHDQVMMMRHDLFRHLYVLRQLSQEPAVQSYLDELIGQHARIPVILQSGNEMIDMILNGRLSGVSGITVEIVSAHAPATLPLTQTDLCSLILNLVDNALAAAAAPGLSHPHICIDLHVKGSYFVFSCKNSCSSEKQENKAGHGFGLKIVENIAARYDCLMEVERTAETYKVTLAIPID